MHGGKLIDIGLIAVLVITAAGLSGYTSYVVGYRAGDTAGSARVFAGWDKANHTMEDMGVMAWCQLMAKQLKDGPNK